MHWTSLDYIDTVENDGTMLDQGPTKSWSLTEVKQQFWYINMGLRLVFEGFGHMDPKMAGDDYLSEPLRILESCKLTRVCPHCQAPWSITSSYGDVVGTINARVGQ